MSYKDLGYHEEVLLRTTFMDVLTSVFKKVTPIDDTHIIVLLYCVVYHYCREWSLGHWVVTTLPTGTPSWWNLLPQ